MECIGKKSINVIDCIIYIFFNQSSIHRYNHHNPLITQPHRIQPIIITQMIKTLALFFLAAFAASFLISADKCPHDLEVLCIDDINAAYPVCEKAAEAKGKDVPADLECIKYFEKVEKECWPCICQIATAAHWKIKGC